MIEPVGRSLKALAIAILLLAAPAFAQVLPEGPIIAAADLRPGQDLSGEWTYSIDPYRDGLAGFHGEAAGTGHRRGDDTDAEAASDADPLALYEYDMDRSATVTLPSSWLTHSPEMRHYQGMRLRAIGEILGTSEEAAKNCLFRATQKMRVALGDFV